MIESEEATGVVATGNMSALTAIAPMHEGHGESSWHGPLLHYLMGPVHLPVVLAVFVALVVILRKVPAWRLQRKRIRRGAERPNP